MKQDPLPMVIIGHVDHGKSTLIGRLLFETQSLPKDRITEIKRISQELGKEVELAFLMDHLKEEREKNMTIDSSQLFFKTRKRKYAIIDSPGHVELTKNMITGASRAEAALLIIDIQQGIMEQTRRHAYIVNMLGIKQLIVVINKMDLVDYKEKPFTSLKKEVTDTLKKFGHHSLSILPISSKTGANISKRFPQMRWFRGESLIQAIDALKTCTHQFLTPLRLPIQDIYKIDDREIIIGKIVSGTLKQGQEIVLHPSLKKSRIKEIVVFSKRWKRKAQKDENIGLTLAPSITVERGTIIADQSAPPKITHRFEGNLFWMSQKPLRLNDEVNLRCSTQNITSTVEKIEHRMNSSTLEILEENANELHINEVGLLTFRTTKPLIVDKFNMIQEMGRFVIEKNAITDGAGIIQEEIVS